ncbi:MAG: hypothetical protein QXU69_04525 [Thermofilaceae archaeon]
MPVANPELVIDLAAASGSPWDVVVTVKIRDPATGKVTTAPADSVRVHLFDVDEATGMWTAGLTDFGWKNVDANGQARFTGVGGAWWNPLTFSWCRNRLRIEAEHKATGKKVSKDIWLDTQWGFPVGQVGVWWEFPAISDAERKWSDPPETYSYDVSRFKCSICSTPLPSGPRYVRCRCGALYKRR